MVPPLACVSGLGWGASEPVSGLGWAGLGTNLVVASSTAFKGTKQVSGTKQAKPKTT